MLAVAIVLALQLVVVFGFVVRERREPQATLAWILGVVLVPILGAAFYLAVGIRRIVVRNKKAGRVGARVREVFLALPRGPEVERCAR
ncbi:MAG: PLDc N-terminal domain-containing protein [Myxococcota bacterium]